MSCETGNTGRYLTRSVRWAVCPKSNRRELLKKYLAIETEEEALDSNFYKQVADAISAKKTLLLFRAEHDFRRQLIRQMQQHKGSRGN